MTEPETNADLLNLALELTTEWGENYGKPIDERILLTYPELSAEEIHDLTVRSRCRFCRRQFTSSTD